MSLERYIEQTWSLVEPASRFSSNWHVKAICQHLEHLASDRPEFFDLVNNIPPGCMKSLLTSVFWPTWVWTWKPETRWMFASYSQHLSTRDSVRRRRLIESDWFRKLYGVRLTGDQNVKTKFDNTASGWMFATSVGGAGTGEHPDFVVIDDPHSAAEADSRAERERAIEWFGSTVVSRGVVRDVRRVIAMQRLHREDLSGYLLKDSPGSIVHICLPMEYEGKRMERTPLGFSDPRTMPGELLWPELFTRRRVDKLKQNMTAGRQAGQLQQRPPEHDDASEWPSSYFDAITFQDWPAADKIVLRCSYLDPSLGKSETSDFSALVNAAFDKDGNVWCDADIERRDTSAMARLAAKTCRDWGPQAFGCESNGFQELLLPLFQVEAQKENVVIPAWMLNNSVAKVSRIRRLTPWLSQGKMFIRDSLGGRLLIEQLRDFPNARHDDGPDALEGVIRLAQEIGAGHISTETQLDNVGV